MATSSAASAPQDQREQMWAVSFETYYDAYFEELVADRLINKLGRLDDVTKVLVALTASGSAISGWVLWGISGWKYVWLASSGIAALLSIIHTALSIPDRIKGHADDKRRFAVIRTSLETLRYRLRLERFDADQFNKEFVDLRRAYSDGIGLLKSDTFRTKHFEIVAQQDLNQQLKDQIE